MQITLSVSQNILIHTAQACAVW